MTLAVTAHGHRGSRLACLHGWGLSSCIWAPLADDLNGQLSLQVVDLPGHGESHNQLAGLGGWTESLLASIDTPTVLMGWSLGGVVALNAARVCPQAVVGLILVATLPRMLRTDDWQWGMKASAVAATARGLEQDFEGTLQGFLQQQVLSEPGAGSLARRLQPDLVAHQPSAQGLADGLDILHQADLRSELGAIRCPALVIAGERDRIAHPDGMAWMAEQMPRAEYWRVPGAAHAPFLSNRHEFARRITAFVQ